jgi:hypothetical protein
MKPFLGNFFNDDDAAAPPLTDSILFALKRDSSSSLQRTHLSSLLGK